MHCANCLTLYRDFLTYKPWVSIMRPVPHSSWIVCCCNHLDGFCLQLVVMCPAAEKSVLSRAIAVKHMMVLTGTIQIFQKQFISYLSVFGFLHPTFWLLTLQKLWRFPKDFNDLELLARKNFEKKSFFFKSLEILTFNGGRGQFYRINVKFS